MRGRIHLLKSAQRHVRVDLRGLDVLVSQDHLNVPDVGPVLVHVRGHAVPQEMTRANLADLRGHDVNAHRPREMVAAERFTVRAAPRRRGGSSPACDIRVCDWSNPDGSAPPSPLIANRA